MEVQVSQPHTNSWEDDRSTNPENYFQGHGQQENHQEQSGKIHREEMMLVNKGRAMDIVCLDFNKAFNIICHKEVIS